MIARYEKDNYQFLIESMNGIVIFGKRVDEENGKKVFYF